MTIKELRALTEKELRKQLEAAKVDLQKIRIGIRTKHEKDTSKANKTKRFIAQISTILNEIENEAPKEVKSA